MADRIYATQAPVTPQADADTHHWGMRFTVSANGNCTGGRAWVHASGRPGTFFWQLWRVAGAVKLAEVNLNLLAPPAPGAWMSFTSANFTVPGNVALAIGQTYIVNVFFQTGDGVFTNPAPVLPIGVGVVSSDSGIFNNILPQNTIPATPSGTYFFADLEFEEGEPVTGVLDVTLPPMVADAVGLVDVGGSLDVTMPAMEVSMIGVSAAGGSIMGPCGWTIPAPLCCEQWTSFSPAVQAAAGDYAATVLWAATGRRFGLCEVTVRPCGMKRCDDGLGEFSGWEWSGGTWMPYIFNGVWFNCVCPGICCCEPRCQVRLVGPVDSIVEVTIGGIAVDPATYRVDDQHWLVRTGGLCWPFCADLDTDDGDNVFAVTYLRGDPVPASLLGAASTLECEWGKACTGDGTCRLGNRVTSLARNGVTIDMTSAEELLTAGLTGIFEVDQIIRAWNPYGQKERRRIKAPELNYPRQVTSP